MDNNEQFKKELDTLLKKHKVSLQIVQNINIVPVPEEEVKK